MMGTKHTLLSYLRKLNFKFSFSVYLFLTDDKLGFVCVFMCLTSGHVCMLVVAVVVVGGVVEGVVSGCGSTFRGSMFSSNSKDLSSNSNISVTV